MRDHNGSKPKAEWKPPPDYKSALAKAHDAQKQKEKKEKDAKGEKGQCKPSVRTMIKMQPVTTMTHTHNMVKS